MSFIGKYVKDVVEPYCTILDQDFPLLAFFEQSYWLISIIIITMSQTTTQFLTSLQYYRAPFPFGCSHLSTEHPLLGSHRHLKFHMPLTQLNSTFSPKCDPPLSASFCSVPPMTPDRELSCHYHAGPWITMAPELWCSPSVLTMLPVVSLAPPCRTLSWLLPSSTTHPHVCRWAPFPGILTRLIQAKVHLALQSSANLNSALRPPNSCDPSCQSTCVSRADPQHCPCLWDALINLSRIVSVYFPWHTLAPNALLQSCCCHPECLCDSLLPVKLNLFHQVRFLSTWIHPLGLLSSIPQPLLMFQSHKVLLSSNESNTSLLPYHLSQMPTPS